MRILYLHQYFTTPDMSGGTRSYEMARRLVAAGHEVHVITSTRLPVSRSRVWREETVDGICVHAFPVPYSNRMTLSQRVAAFGKFAMVAGGRARQVGGDVLFATSTPLTIALPAVYATRRLGIPMVFEVRDLWPAVPIAMGILKEPVSKGLARGLERFAYRNSEHVVALSDGMREGVLRTGYPAHRVTVVPNACDFALFDVPASQGEALRTRHAWLGARPMVLYCGTLGTVNGLEYMIRMAAAALPLQPDVRFVIVGSGKEAAQLRALAGKLGVLDVNLFMLDRVPKSDVPAWLSAADLATSFVVNLPELWMNSANKFFDALAASRPIAVNHGGWQAELIEKRDCGVVLPPEDPQGGTAILLQALGDRAWLRAAGAAAGRLGAEQFDRDDLAFRLRTVLESVVH